MKIAIPTANGKLCSHFGHCESFTFVDVDLNKKEITEIINDVPDGGVTCQCATWVVSKGTNLLLAGGIGGNPANVFMQNGVEVIAGCPEMEIKELVCAYLNNSLTRGENSCGHGSGHSCHGDGHHHCGGH